MRRYDIVTGILLILPIINFALAAPVLAQEKHQARVVDVVHMPKDLTTVLGKRWEEELEKLGEGYFETSGKSIDSSSTHSSTSPAQSPTSSTSNPDQSMEPSCSPSGSSKQGLSARGNSWGKNCLELLEDMSAVDAPRAGPMLHVPDYGPYHQLPTEPPSMEMMEYSNSDREHLVNAEKPPPPGPPSTPPRPTWPKVPYGQTSGYGPGPPPTGSEHEVAAEPSTSSDSTLPDHQSLGAGAQPADLQAALYAMKGKAKESRGISGTARDVENVIQRELEPAERSLDPGE